MARAQRDKVLPKGWRKSADIAWTTSGDANGFHILTAAAGNGYTWRTVASLAEPGFDVDQWIGNACLTGSGQRLVVVYAPRTFTNDADLFDRGGFTAVVDLKTGAVAKLPVQTSLAYFNPGCGAGETAVVTQFGGKRLESPEATKVQSRLLTVDAAAGKLSKPILLDTELTSPVPVGDGVVAAGAGRLVKVTRTGKLRRLASTNGVAFRLVPDASGGVVFMDRERDTVRVKRTLPASTAKATSLAEGGLTTIGLARGAAGTAFVTGTPTRVGSLPTTVRRLDTPQDSEISSRGAVALTRVHAAGPADPRVATANPLAPREVRIDATVLPTGKKLSFAIAPEAEGAGAKQGRTPHPELGTAKPAATGARRASAAGSPSDPVEAEAYCAVPRNDPRNQAVQPKPRQVEWAVNQAVTGSLNTPQTERPANWKNLGMPAYRPQGLFPSTPLAGGGRVPAQIMLGIVAQESNLWQAARYALPGVTANPLIGNYYGRDIYNDNPGDDWDIKWEDSDCGYGVAQVTDGMRKAGREKKGEKALEPHKQRAVALDFAANISAGLQILQDKWNQTRAAGLTVHNGDPATLENWFFAVWAYNSGFYPKKNDTEPWGVGWLNNPINPRYDQQREPFLESYDDARTPQKWPYPEKILGWAGHPIEMNESPDTLVHGYRSAWWSTTQAKLLAKPPVETFCNQSNSCIPGAKIQPNDTDLEREPAGPCAHQNPANQKYDLKCWFNQPVGWRVAPGQKCETCGNEVLRFDPGYAYQEDGTSFPPKCDLGGLPDKARIIDNLKDDVPSVRPCARPWQNAGTFNLDFAADAKGMYPSKVDFHQIGAGFGAHMWRAHTVTANHLGGRLKVAGTWQLAQPINGWARILVSIPDHGAWTPQAKYTINLGNGETRYRVINQTWQQHRWIDLGVFPVAGNPSVTLTNVTADGNGNDSIVFDAVAFVPTSKPTGIYVAMGDSYSSGEGIGPYDRNSDHKRTNGNGADVNACHRSISGAYPRLAALPGQNKPIAQQAAEGSASFAFIACSGAKTTSVATEAVNDPPAASDRGRHTDWGSREFRHGELTQVDQGYLDKDTTHVSISIGGNDARFAEVIRGCIAAISFCNRDDYKLTRDNGAVDPEPLREYEAKLLREWLPAKLKAVYRAIHKRAPKAKIVVVGYPNFFPDERSTTGCYTIMQEEQLFLNRLGYQLATSTAKAVDEVRAEGADIRFVNSTLKWRIGEKGKKHWACIDPTQGDTESWTNSILNYSESGSGEKFIGVGSFHPNAKGQQQLALLVQSAWQGDSSMAAVKKRIVDYVATRKGDRWTITDRQAELAAQECLHLARRGGVVDDPCMRIPIFFPSSYDAGGAAENDHEGIIKHPSWVLSNYMSSTHEKPKLVHRDWFTRAHIKQTGCALPKPDKFECDEFPYYSSEYGGAWDTDLGGESSSNSTNLKWVHEDQNGAEGSILGGMYHKTECRMTSGEYDPKTSPAPDYQIVRNGSPHLTVPLLGSEHVGNKTFYVC